LKSAPLPEQENDRLAELRRYHVLDTPNDPAFDRVTRIASELFGVPMALVSLVDENRQWFKAFVGLSASETSRDVAFCAHAILKDEVFIVEDAHADPRFFDNPLVTGPPHIRFYAGAPLVTPTGLRVGTLCTLDTRARSFAAHEARMLATLARIVVDLLELHRKTNELADANARIVTIIDSMDEVVVAIDAGGRTMLFNDAARRQLGHASASNDPAAWVAATQVYDAERIAPLPPERLPIVRALGGEVVRGETLALRGQDGGFRLHCVNASPFRGAGGQIVGSVSVGRDVTEERRLQELERTMSRTDPLTGLGNRRALDDVAPHALARADRRDEKPVAVALFDLDHFKRINDTAGHDTGDEVLREVARVFRAAARASDVLVRWGGEELLAFLPECDLDGARGFAERVREAVSALSVGRAGALTISAGIAVRAREEALEVVIARADARLYEAKSSGRDRVC
jgi:diguanylate cyclase (GGDEF)-like protein